MAQAVRLAALLAVPPGLRVLPGRSAPSRARDVRAARAPPLRRPRPPPAAAAAHGLPSGCAVASGARRGGAPGPLRGRSRSPGGGAAGAQRGRRALRRLGGPLKGRAGGRAPALRAEQGGHVRRQGRQRGDVGRAGPADGDLRRAACALSPLADCGILQALRRMMQSCCSKMHL